MGSSPDGLAAAADAGLRCLGAALSGVDPERLLLVHCGDLPGVGPGATRMVLDVREHTESMHRCVPARPAQADLDPLRDRTFAAAACWPRAHLGLDFSRANLALGALHLEPGGELWCAARRQKGGKRLAATMDALLGNVRVHERDRGYHVYASRRGDGFDHALAHALLSVEYRIRDALLGHLELRSVPGVFSRRELDAGTRVLLHHASRATGGVIERIVDLGTGVGALALWAADRFPGARVLAIDSNYLACALARENAQRAGLGERVVVAVADGLDGVEPSSAVDWHRRTNLFLINPPTHESPEGLARLLAPIGTWLEPGGLVLAVVNRRGRATAALRAAGLRVDCVEYEGYAVLEARAQRNALPAPR